MSNYSIAKSCIGREFLYNRNSVIYCGSKKRATEFADFLNSQNETTIGEFKLKDGEIWYVHQDIEPVYKISKRKNGISVKYY